MENTYNPLLSSRRIRFSSSRLRTFGSRQSSDIAGAQACNVCTGSDGSSHQPLTSPEPDSGVLGLWIFGSAKCFFQFEPVRTEISWELLLIIDVAGDVGDRGDVRGFPDDCEEEYEEEYWKKEDEVEALVDAGGMVIRGAGRPARWLLAAWNDAMEPVCCRERTSPWPRGLRGR